LAKNIRAVFFDLFGTLFIFEDLEKSWKSWSNTFYSYIEKSEIKMSFEEFTDKCSTFFERPEPVNGSNRYSIYEKRIIEFLDAHNIKFSESDLTACADMTIEAWQQYVTADPCVTELFAKLKLNYKIALISNFDHPRHIYKLFENYKWSMLFDKIVISAETGYKKPDKRIFDLALNNLELRPEEVIFIGDSREDIQGAINAGIQPVLIHRPSYPNTKQYGHNSKLNSEFVHHYPGTAVIGNLWEIENLIKI